MTARRQGWRQWAVRVFALLFAVHGALLAVSQGASADTLRRDQFGNVLCLASAETGHGGAKHGKADPHSEMMECCTLGCAMFAGLADAPPFAGGPIDSSAPILAKTFVSYRDALAGYAETPRTTRGPPTAA